ncbi:MULTISPECIES: hypothetical protein [unclassified Pseudomonas]|uniref:hypothetical protein n=1 Tax=unclassified Pseudomonas TaxID=196821 RepID=UPI002AC9B1E1|nr:MULTISPECIES: hypothetical protein [unclassified Pseudomonas]MEB0046300.1 hypothetical protein [Pseudomonas sp. Dout3]MEB0097775.1 hypothetical protein [Pseudomonas sp. DC1.2]WPX57641.1 hypothetical protein RHM68_18760 [Pseudomonas sp. DC1.2]
MLVSAQKTPIIQHTQRSDMDPTTAAASALYSGLIQNAQNTGAQATQGSSSVQASGLTSATQQVNAASTISDNVNEAFAKTRVALQAAVPAATQAKSTDSTALADFKDYMSKTPEQQMRDSILKGMGITQTQLSAMPADQQLAIGKQITQSIEDKMKLAQTDTASSSTDKATTNQLADKFLASL